MTVRPYCNPGGYAYPCAPWSYATRPGRTADAYPCAKCNNGAVSLAVAVGGAAFTSVALYGNNGTDYTAVPSPIATGLGDGRCLALHQGRIFGGFEGVDVGHTGDGATWARLALSGTGDIYALASSGAIIAGCGESGRRIVCAGDATSLGAWTSYTQGGGFWYSVVWAGTQFVYGGGGGSVATNPDGTSGNDTARSNNLTNSGQAIRHLAYADWLGVLEINAVGQVGLSADNGNTWTETVSAISGFPFVPMANGSAHDGAKMILCGGTSLTNNQLRRTTDGTTFVAISGGTGIASRPNGIAHSADLGLWIVAHENGTIRYSADGETGWATATGTAAAALRAVMVATLAA